MRGRMTQHVKTFQRLRQHRFDPYHLSIGLRIESVCQIDFASIDARSQRLLRHVAIKLLQSFPDRNRRRHLRGWTTVELYVNLTHLSLILQKSRAS